MNELRITVTHNVDQQTILNGDGVEVTYQGRTVRIHAHPEGGFGLSASWGTLVLHPEAANAVRVVEESFGRNGTFREA